MLTSALKQRINSTYANYDDGTVELEARFGRIGGKSFKSGVTRQVFNRVREYFKERAQEIETKTTDYIFNSVRKTVTSPIGGAAPEIIWIEKNRLWNQEDPNYGIRYSMSREIPIQPVDNYNPQIIREKNRYSYVVFNNTVQIDLTIVNMINQKESNYQDSGTTYEVEIESISPDKNHNLNTFENAITVTLHQVLDTIVLYNNNDANDVISSINRILGSNKRGVVDHYPLVQARNLKLKDMVWGGLIGNPKTSYSVTHKADGQRKMLVFHNTGVWLIAAPHSLNRVSSSAIPTLTGTILDGEYIPLNKRLEGAPDSKIWYLAFDCLSWNNNRAIQEKPHGIRMYHAQAVADNIKTKLIYITTKSFRNFSTPQEFYKVMRDMFGDQEVLSYKQDGFMFTPSNTIYNPHSDYNPLWKRTLTVYPDVCKWKPKEELTIDFQIRWKITPQGRQIQLYVNEKGKPVVFNGTTTFPYQNSVDSGHELTANLPNGTVVEYGWDYDRKILVPHRVRHDKTKPNKIDIAQDVWLDIQNPLDKDTMEGNNFVLLRKYHNKIKKDLIGTVPNLTLLDIGSGRGGDVSKWHKFSKIVAVEPNKEHIIELQRRIDLNGMTDKVRIVNTGGEDIETIYRNVREFIGGRVDVISMMLSMSFFWRSQSMVNRLVNTMASNIKPDGNIIFFTIDGDLVEQTFEPAMNTGPAINRLDLGPATLNYFGDKVPKELHIHIEGTIVEDQTEWLVRLGDLIVPLRRFGFDFTQRQRADEERFLTEEEITLTQMYTSGVISKAKDGIGLPEIDQVLPGKEVDPGLPTDPNEIPPLHAPLQRRVSNILEQPNINPMINDVLDDLVGLNDDEKISEIKTTTEMNNQIGTALPQLPTVPSLSGTTLPQLPSVPGTTLHQLPTLGTLPGLPTLGTLPGLPTLGTLPGLPTLGTLPGLPTLGTTLPPLGIPEMELSGIPTDTYQILTVSWYPKETVVRIGAIGDGSCFFHSVLGGYYPPYQNNGNEKKRMEFVRKLRRDIAYTLEMPDSNRPGKIMWETAANGQYLALYEQQELGLELTDMFGVQIDFSLNGLQQLFNSLRYLGDEVYQYVSDILGIDIYVMRLTNKDLYVHLNTSIQGVKRKAVVISGNGSHYETIGVERGGLFQTVFDQNDPFILAIRSLITDEGGYN